MPPHGGHMLGAVMRTDEKTFVERLSSLSRVAEPAVVREELAGVRVEDLAEGLSRLETEEGLAILNALEERVAAEVLVELPTETARKFVAALPDATLAHYLDILPMDDALDLREELPADRFEALLEVIPPEDAQEIRRLMVFPEDSAGQLMTERFASMSPDETISDILRKIRRAPEGEFETVNDIYVLDADRHLLGVFSLRQAIRADLHNTARDVMVKDVVTCSSHDKAEDVARQIARYGFYAMPVLDYRGRMLGIFTVDDAQSVLSEADTEDVLKLGAVTGDVEAYLSLGTIQLVKRRLPWLLFLFVAETLTGAVLRHYTHAAGEQESVSQAARTVITLGLFIPLIIGAGGNSGSQVTTTITRALAVGELRTSDYVTVLRRELVTASIMGFVLGALGFLRALLGWSAGFDVSLVVGIALPVVVLWAATVGSVLPLTAKRVGVDPAVMSAPFITTFVDATGLIIYFEIARRVLGIQF